MFATIVGAQLGDEGKGGIVDAYSETADVVARYQGGDNAGHTVVEAGEEYKLSLVPSGAIQGKVGVLGNGCVVNPRTLFDELTALRDRGIDPNLRIARRAHVIFPYHRVLDSLEEDLKSDEDLAAGTTGRGIGPAYEDKAGRRGIRVGDLLAPDTLRDRLSYVVPRKRALLTDVYEIDPDELTIDGIDVAAAFDVDALFEEFVEYGRQLKAEDMTVNAGVLLSRRANAGENILLEGAQGTALDIDHGIYPYVTSSNPTAGYAATGTGVGITEIGHGEVIGVIKAYLSRVGTGPLPTELGSLDTGTEATDDDIATYIRDRGGEYGTVTGRPRRIGWLDIPMLRHATRVSGFTGLAINHIDVLSGLDEINVAHAYQHDGETIETMPATTEQWGKCSPVYRTFDGWPDVDWAAVAETGYSALPENAKTYIEYIESELDVTAYAIGVGPDRSSTILRTTPFDT